MKQFKNGRVVCIPDVHVPHQDKRAWGAALNLVADQQRKNTHTIQLGDFADNEAFGRHGKAPGSEISARRDLQLVEREARNLQSAAGGDIKFLLGNHCNWVAKYQANQAPMAESLLKPLREVFGYDEDPIPYQQPYWVGRVAYLHDVGYSGANATRQTLAALGHCVCFGHTHRAAVEYSGSAVGAGQDRWFAMNCGWLGDPSAITYMAPSRTREWQTGLGVVDYVDGLAFARFIPFVRGRFYLDGKSYK